MAPRYRLTRRALNDLEDIWNYIAEDSEEAANRFEAAVFSTCRSLASHPLIGARRVEITSLTVRFWAVAKFPNYLVVYLPDSKPLRVVALLHGKRDIAAIL